MLDIDEIIKALKVSKSTIGEAFIVWDCHNSTPLPVGTKGNVTIISLGSVDTTDEKKRIHEAVEGALAKSINGFRNAGIIGHNMGIEVMSDPKDETVRNGVLATTVNVIVVNAG